MGHSKGASFPGRLAALVALLTTRRKPASPDSRPTARAASDGAPAITRRGPPSAALPSWPGMKDDALLAFLVALAVAGLLTPLVARLARRVGAVDGIKERGLAREATPLLGGLAIFAAALVAALLFLPLSQSVKGILGGAALITALGALDDWRELGAPAKL